MEALLHSAVVGESLVETAALVLNCGRLARPVLSLHEVREANGHPD